MAKDHQPGLSHEQLNMDAKYHFVVFQIKFYADFSPTVSFEADLFLNPHMHLKQNLVMDIEHSIIRIDEKEAIEFG